MEDKLIKENKKLKQKLKEKEEYIEFMGYTEKNLKESIDTANKLISQLRMEVHNLRAMNETARRKR